MPWRAVRNATGAHVFERAGAALRVNFLTAMMLAVIVGAAMAPAALLVLITVFAIGAGAAAKAEQQLRVTVVGRTASARMHACGFGFSGFAKTARESRRIGQQNRHSSHCYINLSHGIILLVQ